MRAQEQKVTQQGGEYMNYSAMIQNRKSVRAFTDKKVPFSVVQEIKAYYENAVKRLVPELKTQLHLYCDDVKAALEGITSSWWAHPSIWSCCLPGTIWRSSMPVTSWKIVS